jgi:hypothetical protein
MHSYSCDHWSQNYDWIYAFAMIGQSISIITSSCGTKVCYHHLSSWGTLPWVPEPSVIEVRTRRGGSGHTSTNLTLVSSIFELCLWLVYIYESFHWLTDAHRLTNEKAHINLNQSQTEFKYWTHQSEAGCSCDQSLLVVSLLLLRIQETLAPRVGGPGFNPWPIPLN